MVENSPVEPNAPIEATEAQAPFEEFEPSVEGTSQPEEHTESTADPIDKILENIDPSKITPDMLEDLIDQHPDARVLMEGLRQVRQSALQAKTTELELTEKSKAARSAIGQQIMERLGIGTESEESQVDREENERQAKLKAIRESLTGEESEEELLGKFGFLNAEGQLSGESISSPLFKSDTRGAFSTYLRYVAQFEAFASAEQVTGVGIRNTQQASNLRGEAHNAVANLVARDIGLDFGSARRFVAKMRDTVVPGTGERTNYAQLLRGQKLGAKYGHDAGRMTKETLGPLLKQGGHNTGHNSRY
jgi:hypothetical protein